MGVMVQVRRGLAFHRMHERASLPMLAARNAVVYGRPRDARVVIDFVADVFGVEASTQHAEP
jgi:ribosome biogenesis protein Tsr3